jgi:GTP pyrophosphokinase
LVNKCSPSRINLEDDSSCKFISCARCCYPIPGDKVAGILTSSKGLVLHRFDCGNLLRAKQKDEQWLEVDWQADDDEIDKF